MATARQTPILATELLPAVTLAAAQDPGPGKMASGAIRIRMEPMRQMSGSSFPTMARWNGTISEQMEP